MSPGAATGRGWLLELALRTAFLYYLIANLVGVARVLDTIDRPFGGFVWLFDDAQGHLVGFETGPSWPGRQVGLMFDDRIVRINGRAIPISGKPDVIAEVYASTPIGQIVKYEVERPGIDGRLYFRLPVSRFTLRYAAEAYLPFILAAFALWGMGFFVHLVGPRDEVASLFALFCLVKACQRRFRTWWRSVVKPVMMITIWAGPQRQSKIDRIEKMGYKLTLVSATDFLCVPCGRAA